MHPFAPIPSNAGPAAEAADGEPERPRRTREERRITLWRYAQARHLGLEPLHARLFAESQADLGELRGLRSRGCAPRLALQIVL